MYNKIYNLIILCALLMFINLTNLNALPSTIGPIKQNGNTLIDECGEEDSDGEGTPDCYGVPLKVYESQNQTIVTIGTNYDSTSPTIGNNVSCNKTNDWEENIRYGIASVIKAATPDFSVTTSNLAYFAAEMAINIFLYEKVGNGAGAQIATDVLTQSFRDKTNEYLNLANTAYNIYGTNSTIELELSTTELNFSLGESGYVSDWITVSGATDYTATTNKGNIEKDGNSIRIFIPTGTVSEKTDIILKVNATKTIELASNYNCGADYQSLTPVLLETKTINSNEVTATGTLIPKAQLVINKVDSNNTHISGATFEVTGTKGYKNTFKTTGNPVNLVNLEYDTYTIKETEAPVGYLLADEKTVTLSENNLSSEITIINKKTKVTILKVNSSNGKGLAGAKLEIQDSDGNVVKFCNDSECKWTSTKEAYIIEGMPLGKYYLIETKSPEGYVLNEEKVEFEINGDGKTVQVKIKNDLEVKVPDTLSSKSVLMVAIAMFDIFLGISILNFIKFKTKDNH